MRLILEKKEDEKTIVDLRRLLEEERERCRVFREEARSATQWAAKVEELTSQNERLKREKFVVFLISKW